ARLMHPTPKAAPPKPTRALRELPAPPYVTIIDPKPFTVTESNVVTVRVRAEERGGGMSAPRLFHNGHRVAERARAAVNAEEMTFQVTLLQGENNLSEVAFNNDGTLE